MFYIRKIDDYLKILPEDEVKYSVAVNFSEYFKSAREKFYFKLSEGQNLRKVAELLNLMQSNSSDNLKKQIKIIVKWVEKVQTILVLEYKKKSDRRIFHSSAKLIASDSDILSSIVYWGYQYNFKPVYLKNFARTKARHEQKSGNKTKIS